MGNKYSSRYGDLTVDKLKGSVHEDWALTQGTLDDNSVTIFTAVHPHTSRKRPFMEKSVQFSKVYRHPGILKFLRGDIHSEEVTIITEQATPLLDYGIDFMSPLEIAIGLSSIIEALIFLHDKAGASHNNVGPASIFITSEGLWKLSGFEYLCSFGELTRDHIERINQYCYGKAIPPDDKSRISPAYQHARDSFALGKFIEEHIAPLINMDSDTPNFVELLDYVKSESLNTDWAMRPRLSKLRDVPFFKHEYLEVYSEVKNILLLSPEKKDALIESLPPFLRKYPEELVVTTFGPCLMCREVFLIPSAGTKMLPCLLTPKERSPDGILSSSVFRGHLLPLIMNLFAIHDVTVRKILLTSFGHYSTLISKELLKNTLLPEILLGIKDTDESLNIASLKSLAHLVPLLGANIVIGQHREQIFVNSTPKSSTAKDILKMKKKKGVNLRPVSPPDSLCDMLETTTEDADGTLKPSLVFPLPAGRILERSAPDGGETSDDEVSSLKSSYDRLNRLEINESWSDWEEKIPEIVGVDNDLRSISPSSLHRKKSNSSSISSSSPHEGNQLISAKNLPPNGKEVVSLNLGEEYSIKSIKLDKKKNSDDTDLFADLAPNLNPRRSFDLETMLMAASNEVSGRSKLPSVSDTLAELELNCSSTVDGDDCWQDDVFPVASIGDVFLNTDFVED